MLIVLIFLLVFLLGLVVSMRGSIIGTQLVGNNLQRQKDVQVGDIALAQVEALMTATSRATGTSLEIAVGSGSAQPAWYRDVPAGTAPPPDTYWASCLGNSDPTLRCASLPVTNNGTNMPYNMLAVVQPTGRHDTSNSTLSPYLTANYYAIYLRMKESSGATTSVTETIYKLCVNT